MRPRLHMVGIGGIGMSALAEIMLARGESVSGSDARASDLTARLADLGAEVTIGHRGDLIDGAARVVVSDAVPADNPEVSRARAAGIPVQRRSALMAELMRGARAIAVSGSHGKTTVTAMIAAILVRAGLDPTVVLGGAYRPLGGNARAGRGGWFVAEACEAYASFLDLQPEIAVVTNIEPDHLDYHKTEERLRASFARFLEGTTEDGCLVLCADRPELRTLPLPRGRDTVWYGTDSSAQVRGTEVELSSGEGRCRLSIGGRKTVDLRIGTPGAHNVVNALGAVAAAMRAGAPPSVCTEALADFTGVARRFEVIGQASGVTFVDDYAHHPTEVAATIAAARAAFPRRRIVAIFQPHLFSRTRDFAEEFAGALAAADLATVADIYPAREEPMPGVTASLIAEHLRRLRGEDGVLELAKEDLPVKLPPHVRPGDVILFMGAGDIGAAARRLLGHLGGRATREQEGAAKQ